MWLIKKSGGYFTLLEGVSLRVKHHSKNANFNLKEWKTTQKRVVLHMALERVPFHSFTLKAVDNIGNKLLKIIIGIKPFLVTSNGERLMV